MLTHHDVPSRDKRLFRTIEISSEAIGTYSQAGILTTTDVKRQNPGIPLRTIQKNTREKYVVSNSKS